MLYEYYGGTMDPGELNACLTSNGGYMSGCLLYWINSCMPAGVSYDGTSGSIDTALGAGHPVIAHVSNTSTSMHFVVIIGNNGGDYQINDPGWSYQTISAGNYTIEGLRFYSGTPVVCDCTPGDDEQRSCGFCGTETRVCDSSCAWGDWSCVDPGVCEPDNQEACGLCGTRSCDQACQWGACDDPCSVDAGPPDGGADSGSDAAQEEDASNDEDAGDNADAGDEHPGPGVVGGCSCRADDRDGATAPWTFILLGLLALSLRRRRRTK
jgi:MYXO-CTERM domain-containing protein